MLSGRAFRCSGRIAGGSKIVNLHGRRITRCVCKTGILAPTREVSGQAFVASAPAQEETRPLLGEKRDPLHDASLSSQTAAAGMRWHREGRWYTPHFLLAIWTTLVVVLRFDTPLEMPFTTDFSAWYGLSSWVLVALIAAAALWGFRTSLGGRRLIEVPTV